jgi:hypothetical protein
MKLRVTPFLVTAALAFGQGCVSVAKLTNLGDARCQDQFRQGIAKALEEEGESAENARHLAERTAQSGHFEQYGPRAFMVLGPSGTDYTFFVEKKGPSCLLRLVEKQKGFTRYTNNLTYINTQPLPDCQCECGCAK